MNDRTCREYQDDLMAHLEGALDPQAEQALLRHLEACAVCRTEHEWLRAAGMELEAVGDAIRVTTPQVDVVAAVMSAVARGKVDTPGLIPFKPADRMRQFRVLRWAGVMAAAAVLVLVASVLGYRLTRTPAPVSPVARHTPAQPASTATPHKKDSSSASRKEKTQPGKGSPFEQVRRLPAGELYHKSADQTAEDDENAVDAEDLSTDDVLAERRQAITDPAARARLVEWATLTEQKALEIAAAAGSSLEAKVGASQSLPPDQAQRILVAAVAASPSDPFLRDQLAKAYKAQPGSEAQEAAQLQELSALDPDNALNQYKIASNLFSQGDVAGGTAALERAQNLEQVNTYIQEADAAREQALVAGGIDPDAARALVALTSGTSQYADLVGLGNQLLQYGREQEDQGNIAGAQSLYESAQSLGAQLSAGAGTSAEQLAGLDIQSAAIDLLTTFLAANGTSEEAQRLAEQVRLVGEAYTVLAEFFDQLNQLFASEVPSQLFQFMVDFVLQNGDLDLLNQIGKLVH